MSTSRRTVVAAFAGAAAAGPAPAAILDDSPDAELLGLGVQLETAWAAERAAFDGAEGGANGDDAYHRTAAVARRILAVRAYTIDGLRVKARAVAWCYGGDPVDLTLDDRRTTDIRLAHSILADLGVTTVEDAASGSTA